MPWHRELKKLGLNISDDLIKVVTQKIKNLADKKSITLDQLDDVLMKLAHQPITSSSTLISWTKEQQGHLPPEVQAFITHATATFAKYEQALVDLAMAQLTQEQEDKRPSTAIKVSGHLFDQRIIIKILDIIVDLKCDFELVSIDFPHCSNLHSSCILQLWFEKHDEMANLNKRIEELISSFSGCTLTFVDPLEIKQIKQQAQMKNRNVG